MQHSGAHFAAHGGAESAAASVIFSNRRCCEAAVDIGGAAGPGWTLRGGCTAGCKMWVRYTARAAPAGGTAPCPLPESDERDMAVTDVRSFFWARGVPLHLAPPTTVSLGPGMWWCKLER
jgi:hypothetical protein